VSTKVCGQTSPGIEPAFLCVQVQSHILLSVCFSSLKRKRKHRSLCWACACLCPHEHISFNFWPNLPVFIKFRMSCSLYSLLWQYRNHQSQHRFAVIQYHLYNIFWLDKAIIGHH